MLCDPPWELEVPASAPEPETRRPPVLRVAVCWELSDKPVALPKLVIRSESAVLSEVRLLSWIKTDVRLPSAETDVPQESSYTSDVDFELS